MCGGGYLLSFTSPFPVILFSDIRIAHVPLNIINKVAYLYSVISVIGTVMSASGRTCVELSTTWSKVPHHTYMWWGPSLEFSLGLVLGDVDVSSALVIYIVIDLTWYSCYLVYPLYTWSCWYLTHGLWN